MTKKYANRSMPIITRQSYDVEQAPRLPNWIDEFASALEKQSVQSAKSDRSLFDQISSIMGRKSKYTSVEAAVEDMKERSGMKKFQNDLQVKGTDSGSKKNAETNVDLFKKVPQIKETVDNYITDTHGNLPLPAIVEWIKSIHRSDVVDQSDWDNPNFLRYLNEKNISEKKKYPNQDSSHSNLGKIPTFNDDEIDASNTDAFHILQPNVDRK
jgi:hypothetical protein